MGWNSVVLARQNMRKASSVYRHNVEQMFEIGKRRVRNGKMTNTVSMKRILGNRSLLCQATDLCRINCNTVDYLYRFWMGG